MSELHASLGRHEAAVERAVQEIKRQRIVARIWDHDHTVWMPESKEIINRLGWLHTGESMLENLGRMKSLVESVRADGYTQALLLGMGGSSLAPEVLRKTFGVSEGHLDLAVLDSTDPGAVLTHTQRLDPRQTLFVVSTKSGGTAETLSFFKYFFNWTADALGRERAGKHFIAITDPGSKLESLAEAYGFRSVFLNDPNIGGRYSALSFFGLVPAALIGVDVERLLRRSTSMLHKCKGSGNRGGDDNPGARLGATLGQIAQAGRDKTTWVSSKSIESLGDWVEQLVSESTGKNGRGILPVVGEPLGAPDIYGEDRLFVHVGMEGGKSQDAALHILEQAGHPVVRLRLRDIYDLGAQFFLWEMATAIAGSQLGIHPFDQPDVEAAKILAGRMIAAYQKEGTLPEPQPTTVTEGITVFGSDAADTPSEALAGFLAQAETGDYVAIQAYVTPTAETDDALQALRLALRDRTRLATTVGYGPRYLHSTGQLHKGDGGRGLFLQFTSDAAQDVPIPDEAGASGSSLTFGVLKAAQALGDHQALLDAGRRVNRFHLGLDVVSALQKLRAAL